MFIEEVDNIKDVKSLIDELESYGFEQSNPDEPYYDCFLPDRFYATVNVKTMKGYFVWNPDGNGIDVGEEYDLTDRATRTKFIEIVYDLNHGYLDWSYITDLYAEALESVDFERTSGKVYSRTEINKFNNGVVETITAEFDLDSWYGEVTKQYDDEDYESEFHEYNNFMDWAEDAEIIN